MTAPHYDTPRGTRDFVPGELTLRNHVEQVLRGTFESFAFQPVQTPTFESFDLFAARAGDEILESMFTFASDAGRYALRPELTSPVCRMVANGKLDELPRPHRLYYFGSCFRYCRPQEGRHREFAQAGVELIGTTDPLADAESIALAVRTLENLGIPAEALRLRVGNVGIFRSLLSVEGGDDRRLAVQDEVLHDIDHIVHLSEVSDEVASASEVGSAQAAFLNAQLRLLAQIQKQTKYEGEHPIPIDVIPPGPSEWSERATTLPVAAESTYRHAWRVQQDVPDDVADRLMRVAGVRGPVGTALPTARSFVEGTPAVDAFDRLEAVCQGLAAHGVTEFNIVLGTVRNLDFYTGTVFEIDAPLLGERTQICGGGRYDELVERLGGPSLPATGFAFGFDRLVEVVRRAAEDVPVRARTGIDAFVTAADPNLRIEAVRVANLVRAARGSEPIPLRIATELDETADGLAAARARAPRWIVVVDERSESDETYEIHERDAHGGYESVGRKPIDELFPSTSTETAASR